MSDTSVAETGTHEEGAVATVAKAKPPKPRDLTVEEESKLATYYAMCEKGQRFILLAAFEGSAHKAYNKSLPKGGTKVANFEEYCRDRFGLKHDHSYLSRLIGAARVERSLAGESFNVLKLSSGEGAEEAETFRPRLTVRAAEAIAALPESEWQAVYEEATKIPGETTPSELSSNIQRIAGRRDRELHPDKARPGRKVHPAAGRAGTPAPTRKTADPDAATNTAGVEGLGQKRNMQPVQAQTYDGSPEQQFIEAGGSAAEWAAKQAAENGSPEATGDTQDASAPAVDYQAMEEENTVLRSFLKTFVALMEMDTMDVAGLNTLYNDATEFAKAHGL